MSSREGHSRRGCARKRAGMGNEERTLPGKGEGGDMVSEEEGTNNMNDV